MRESLSAKSNRCLTLQTELDRTRDRPVEKSTHLSGYDREELSVKERKIELLKGKVKSLSDQLQEKEKYIYDLETKLKVRPIPTFETFSPLQLWPDNCPLK